MRKSKWASVHCLALGCSQHICLSGRPIGDQQIEQRHLFEKATGILGKKVAQYGATRFCRSFNPDKMHTPIPGGRVGLSEYAADAGDVATIGQPLKVRLLPGAALG
jgi:hypothetical protein